MNKKVERLTYSESALLNRDMFLSGLNSVNIYVEDQGKEYEYEEIFERLFQNQLKIFSIFPLGGKEGVLKGFKEKGAVSSDGKVNIYIVDGDFDNIWVENKIVSPNVIYLTKYNIENYLFSSNTVIRFLRGYLRCSREKLKSKIDFDNWQEEFSDKMGYLFVLFAIVKKYCPNIKSVSRTISDFVDDNGQIIDDEVEKYYHYIEKIIPGIDSLIADVYSIVSENFTGNQTNKLLSIVCGKIQMECFCRFVNEKCNKNIHRETFRNYLLANFEMDSLDFLKQQILKLYADKSNQKNIA